MKVLVTHVSREARARMRATLESVGAEVLEAGTARAALEACRSGRPDVALIDTHVCRRDAAPLLRQIKSDPELFRVSVILVDDDLGLDVALGSLQRGAHDVLADPPRPGELVARVRAAARATAMRDTLLKHESELSELAYTDDLTGLYNRRFLARQLSAQVGSASRHGRRLAIVLTDLDRFKAINDRFGHAAGDTALVVVAHRLRDALREEDVVGRWGGEEFLVLLPDSDLEGARTTAEKLRRCIGDEPVGALALTISAGCAAWVAGESADGLLQRADRALYGAKDSGRDAVGVQ